MRFVAVFAILFAVPLQIAPLAAQRASDLESPAQRLTRAMERVRTSEAPTTTSADASWKSRMLSAAGGAVIGAGLGFFASQLATGDWETEAQRRAVRRPAWAAVGGSIGLALGLSFPLSSQGQPAVNPPLPGFQRSGISRNELHKLGTTHAYEAVEVLRPEWLNDRGPREFGDTPADGLSVYLDGTRIGNLAALRELSTTDIETIRLIDAATATARWGDDSARGVILVVLRGA